MSEDVTQAAAKMTDAQRTCGDVLDRLPCRRCGAETLHHCTTPFWERADASRLINNTPGLHDYLLRALNQEETP